jgi:hypothetical protein
VIRIIICEAALKAVFSYIYIYIYIHTHTHTRTYIVPQKSVNLKYSLVLTGMFRLKPASQFVSQRCELCIEHGRSHFEQFLYIQQVIKKCLPLFNVHFTNHLTDFWAKLYIYQVVLYRYTKLLVKFNLPVAQYYSQHFFNCAGHIYSNDTALDFYLWFI